MPNTGYSCVASGALILKLAPALQAVNSNDDFIKMGLRFFVEGVHTQPDTCQPALGSCVEFVS